MLTCAFVIHMFRRTVHTVNMNVCLKSIINVRSIYVLHVVKSLLMLVDSDVLTLMSSYFLLSTDRHTLKPVFIFLATFLKTFSLINSEHRVEIALLLYIFFQNKTKRANEMRGK